MSNKTSVIAEIGVNHNGDLHTALKLIEKSVDAGADAVKFQAFKASSLVSKSARTAEYQQKTTAKNYQGDFLSSLELNNDCWIEIGKKCAEKKVEFICTPFNASSLDHLLKCGLSKIKVASGEINNFPNLRIFAESKLPVLLSTGMSYFHEVEKAVEWLQKHGCDDITILHCTSLYPAASDTLNLRSLEKLKKINLPLGYSDHSLGFAAALMAVALGAKVIEKHITLDNDSLGPDHAASLDVDNFREFVDMIREADSMLGEVQKSPHPLEEDMRMLARRSWHAKKRLQAGELINQSDIILLRPGDGVAGDIDISGRKLKCDVDAGGIILESFVE
ncbi:N-acetylneuraminate synthase family protein [Alphaproteobacteria bacterium]|nr:N-acetylneuraminate synthase family protein [Alphaproteobacteria bacterium]